MQHEMVVRLTDDKYTALKKEAEQSGQELEDLIQDLLDEVMDRRMHLSIKTSYQPTRRKISELLFEEGLTEHISSGRTLSKKEKAERKKLADFFGQASGMSASEMVIEDRGPY